MVRLIYCEMLGYEAPFGYIHAIKLAQQGNLLEKRVGMYSCTSGLLFKKALICILRHYAGKTIRT